MARQSITMCLQFMLSSLLSLDYHNIMGIISNITANNNPYILVIDYDVLDTFSDRFQLSLLLSDGVHDVITKVSVFITDINDVIPVFPAPVTFTWSESVTMGTQITMMTAGDADWSTAFKLVEYAIDYGGQ